MMPSSFHQIAAAARIALLGLPSRARISSATVLSIALATLVVLGFLAMASGFRSTVEGAGSQDSAIVLAEGAMSEFNSAIDTARLARLENAPGVAADAHGPLRSVESFATISAVEKDGEESSLTLRGMDPLGLAVRPLARLESGRMFTPGRNELVVGKVIAERYRDLKPGGNIRLAGMDWRVVGVFAAGGSAMESEVWADRKLVGQFFGSGAAAQSVRLRLTRAAGLDALQRYLAADPNLKLVARSEKDYFAGQARNMGKLILFVGWPLGIAMAIGALAGALNTMFTSVSTRSGEITTLRILGFRGPAIFLSTMAEALLLVLAGSALGVVLATLFIEGRSASTFGGNLTQIMFRFELTGADVAQATALAIIVGVIGGAIPAWRAARRPLSSALG
jgi:putative ABC transport system permease protein